MYSFRYERSGFVAVVVVVQFFSFLSLFRVFIRFSSFRLIIAPSSHFCRSSILSPSLFPKLFASLLWSLHLLPRPFPSCSSSLHSLCPVLSSPHIFFPFLSLFLSYSLSFFISLPLPRHSLSFFRILLLSSLCLPLLSSFHYLSPLLPLCVPFSLPPLIGFVPFPS